jgi:hypothetical protein
LATPKPPKVLKKRGRKPKPRNLMFWI